MILVVHGAWKGIESMAKKNREWIVIGSPSEDAESVALDHKAPTGCRNHGGHGVLYGICRPNRR